MAPDAVAPKLWLKYPAGMIHSSSLEDEAERAWLVSRMEGRAAFPPQEVPVNRCRHCGAHICAGSYSSRALVLRHHSIQCLGQPITPGGVSFWEVILLDLSKANDLGVLMDNTDEPVRTIMHGPLPANLEVAAASFRAKVDTYLGILVLPPKMSSLSQWDYKEVTASCVYTRSQDITRLLSAWTSFASTKLPGSHINSESKAKVAQLNSKRQR